MARAKRRILPFFIAHLGCPNRCCFCNQHTVAGVQHAPTPQQVAEVLAGLAPAAFGEQAAELAYYGGSFTALTLALQREYLTVARDAVERGVLSGIRLSTRPDALAEPRLSLLREYGVGLVELGVQSLDNAVLQASGRGHSAQHSLAALEQLKQAGFATGVQLMPGLPEDTYQKSVAGALQILALRPDVLRIYPTLVLRDTPLFMDYQQGKFQPQTLAQAVEISATIALIAEYYGVQVIRLGLQPTEEISLTGQVAAGPFHAAFGDLVKGEILRRKAEAALRQTAGDCLYVNARTYTQMLGQHCCNRDYFAQKQVRIARAELADGAIGVGDAIGCHFILPNGEFLQKFHDEQKSLCYTHY